MLWWRIGRASIGFLLDAFASIRGDRDIVDPLIMTVIAEANVAPVTTAPQLAGKYASLDDPPPDELRRPVSVNAVASSLRLPYETVRRRVSRMAKRGVCVITPRGVFVPTQMASGNLYVASATARYERLKAFYFELKGLRALDGIPTRPPEAPRHEKPPIRAVSRLINEYLLRMIDAMMLRLGDPVTGIILLEMARANAEHLTPEQRAVEGPMPDAVRKPIRTLTLARRVGLPPETVRRHVARLDEMGFCHKADGGRLAALEQFGRPGGGHGLADNLQNILRLITRCAALGVLAYWEDEAAAAA